MRNLESKPKSLMSDKERVQDFQRKIYLKAKQDKKFRFYVLYDKIMLPHFMREAYKRCKANDGCAGVDGVTFDDIEQTGAAGHTGVDGVTYEEIEQGGVEGFLKGIINELKNKTYRPQPVRREYVEKSNGKMRPLGIPTIKDRIVQMAVKLVIEPIFEADFEDSSYGFRPRRSTGNAVREIKKKLKEGKVEIFDADLSAYFDTIPHKELMILVAQRISDLNILHLIKMWLRAPVKEKDERKTTGGKKNKVGTPQGGVISPLLSNIYLHLVDKIVNKVNGIFQKSGVEIVRYADDFLLMGKNIPEKVLEYLEYILGRMKLTLNKEKSKIVNGYKESFNFLGFTFRYNDDIYGRKRKYWNVEPSEKSQKKIREKIKEYLKRKGHNAPNIVAKDLNAKIRGWINNFSVDNVSYPAKAKRKLRHYLSMKLRRFYKRKSQRKCKLYSKGAMDYLITHYGLIDLSKYVSKRQTVKA